MNPECLSLMSLLLCLRTDIAITIYRSPHGFLYQSDPVEGWEEVSVTPDQAAQELLRRFDRLQKANLSLRDSYIEACNRLEDANRLLGAFGLATVPPSATQKPSRFACQMY
jgi:hypothetical protein